MGFSLTWLGVRGLEPDVALGRLLLSPTGRSTGYAEHPLSSLSLSNGWLLILADGCDHRIIKAESLARLSAACEVIACSIEEHVMSSSSEYWADGRSVWRVEHDAQESARHISARGELPNDFEELRQQVQIKQDEEDRAAAEVDFFFEVPLLLAQARTGFKHDEPSPEINGAAFEELRDLAPPVKAWWQFWK